MATIVQRGSSWQVKIRRKGESTISRTFDTHKDALRWARAMENRMDDGLYNDLTEAQRTSLLEALDRYGREITPTKKGASVELYRLEMWRKWKYASKSLAAIRTHHISEWRDRRKQDINKQTKQPITPSTIVKELALLSNIYTVARKEWGMSSLINPVLNVRKPIVYNERDRRLRDNEEERLLAAANPLLKAALVLYIETAMRRSELVKLTLSDIDMKRRVAAIHKTKNNKSRLVPLSSRAIKAIEEMISNGHYKNNRLFPITPNWMSQQFIALRKKLGIKDLRLHDLRHEATSRLHDSGKFNAVAIAAITGHDDMNSLKRYSHPKAENLAKKLD